jgi:predicted secreted protein with PEFG-CTERM motif
MKPLLLVIIISSILSLGMVLPTYAQYQELPSSVPSNAQQNQLSLTNIGSLMVGFYTDPQNPTISDQTTFELSFEDKNTQYPLSNVDYKVSISKGISLTYETPLSHNMQGTAKVQYQFKEPGQYQVTVYVTGMNSKQIPQEIASFPLTVGSVVPEFPASAVIVLAVAVTSIVLASSRTRLRISN